MNRLQLHDQVIIGHAAAPVEDGTTVRAAVYLTSSGIEPVSGQLYSTEQLRAMVADLPYPLTPGTHTVTWRGTRYSLDGPPMPRMRRGRVHHYTIPLQRTGPT